MSAVSNNKVSQTQLIDRFQRRVTYVRLSVTDRCDFRCVYCMAEDMTFLPRAKVLTLEEATCTRRGILWLNAKTRTYGKGDAIQGPGWQMVESPRSWEEDSDLFEAMIGVWHITHKNDKPKNIQYNLKHQL